MLIVTGTVRCAPEHYKALIEASLAHVARSRTEPGCIEHGVYEDAEHPRRLFFFEKWASREALDLHFAVEGSRTFMKAVRALATELEGPHVWAVPEG